MFTLPNITMQEPVNSDGIALTSISDPRIQKVADKYPAFATYMRCFKTEFGNAVAPSFIIIKEDAPPTYRTAEAIASFRDLISMSIIPLAWAKFLRFGINFNILYSDWFAIYPWSLDKDYSHLTTRTMAVLGIHDVKQLRAQSTAGVGPHSLDNHRFDETLLNELLRRWHRCYSRTDPAHDDIALFRSLNTANVAALMPAGVDVTIYDIGRAVSLWVSAFEILAPAPSQAYRSVYDLLKQATWNLSENSSSTHPAYDGRNKTVQEILPCWVYGEIYKARNDFLHGNPIDGTRLLVNGSGRSLFNYPSVLYRMALTAFLNLTWKKPVPSADNAEAFAAFVSERMDYTSYQRDIEAALSSIQYTADEYKQRGQALRHNPGAPPPSQAEFEE